MWGFPGGGMRRGSSHPEETMKKGDITTNPLPLLGGAMSVAVVLQLGLSVAAQSPAQQSVAEVNQATAENKQALAHYSWQQQETIALKGDVKDTKLFQVYGSTDGQPRKVRLENTPASSGSGGGRIKHHIVEKKKEKYQEYGARIRALGEQYAQPDPERLQQAFQQGNLMLGSAGIPGQATLMLTNYLKPGDKVTLVFNRDARAIQSLEVRSYLNDPMDAVTIEAQFSNLPDGTNHVDRMRVSGSSKNLLITTENSNYQKTM
jgi:hypothetical protein